MEKEREKRVLPTKNGFFIKYLLSIIEDWELAKAYFERFRIEYINKALEDIYSQLVDKLSYYGGYEIRRKLTKCVEVQPSDCVLDIGPEMGMETFLLAEVYSKVLVAEPDAVTPYLLKGIAEHYHTEDGRRASDVMDIQRAGIIPPNSTWSRAKQHAKPSGIVDFDATGAPDIKEVFGLAFADRIVCHHIGTLMPVKPQLMVLLNALSSYCTKNGVITYCEETSELDGIILEYAEHKGYHVPKYKYYKYKGLNNWLKFPTTKLKTNIAELLPDFTVTLKIFSKDHILTIAQHH
jgi:hypothetical protein